MKANRDGKAQKTSGYICLPVQINEKNI